MTRQERQQQLGLLRLSPYARQRGELHEVFIKLAHQILIGKGVGPQFTENPRHVIGVVADLHDGELDRNPFPLMSFLRRR